MYVLSIFKKGNTIQGGTLFRKYDIHENFRVQKLGNSWNHEVMK